MMKKAILYGISLSLALSLTACGGSNDNTADSAPNASTPAVTEPADTSTPESVDPVQDEAVSEGTPLQAETSQEQLFTSVNETVYATETVNVWDTYSSSGNKLGSLTKAQSVTRTGIGQGEAAGWSRIEFNGQVAYVSSDYLSTTKPQVSTSSSSGGTSSGSTQASKPSTGTTSKPSTGSTSGGNHQTTTDGSEIDTGSENTSSGSSGGLSGLAGAIQQEREDLGYSNIDGGDKDATSNQDYRDWVSGQVNVGG